LADDDFAKASVGVQMSPESSSGAFGSSSTGTRESETQGCGRGQDLYGQLSVTLRDDASRQGPNVPNNDVSELESNDVQEGAVRFAAEMNTMLGRLQVIVASFVMFSRSIAS
jgi:hypothetical protein